MGTPFSNLFFPDYLLVHMSVFIWIYNTNCDNAFLNLILENSTEYSYLVYNFEWIIVPWWMLVWLVGWWRLCWSFSEVDQREVEESCWLFHWRSPSTETMRNCHLISLERQINYSLPSSYFASNVRFHVCLNQSGKCFWKFSPLNSKRSLYRPIPKEVTQFDF